MIETNLAKLLKEKGITQRDLAEITSIRQATLSAYCSDNYKHIVKEHIDILCEYFECSVSDLIEYKSKGGIKMKYYYEYEYAHSTLKGIPVWDYSKEIIEELRKHYSDDLVEVCITDSYYGFWIKRKKGTYEQSKVGKEIAGRVPKYTQFKKQYTYINTNGTVGKSTQVFIENKEKRKTLKI